MKEYEKWIVLPDLQLPYFDNLTILAVEAYMRDVAISDEPWDGWLQIGDFLDFNELSSHNAGYEASIEEDVYETFQAGNHFLDRHQAIMALGDKVRGHPARMVLLEGNHDYRSYDYSQRFPMFERLLDYRRNLHLDERGVEWVECWKDKSLTFQLGNAHFIHGNYTNQYHAKKMVERYGCCIYYGHTHDVMEISIVQMGPDKTIVGKSLGCLCDYKQKYLRGNPTNWQQAISIFNVFPDGFYTEHTIRIFNHRFVGLNGKVYDGAEIANAPVRISV